MDNSQQPNDKQKRKESSASQQPSQPISQDDQTILEDSGAAFYETGHNLLNESSQKEDPLTLRLEALRDHLRRRNPDDMYDIEYEFARGGMGVIHCVYDKKLHRNLAMKILLPKDSRDRKEVNKIVQHFAEEAHITAQLEHPNIVPVHDMGVLTDNNIYFTMKMVEGEPLNNIIQKLKQQNQQYIEEYSLHKRLVIFRKVCDAVGFAHSRGVIHRDIKPSNIMIGHYGEVLLMDWGLAKYMGNKDKEGESSQGGSLHSLRTQGGFDQTQDGIIQGSPLYMSPEQATGNPKLVNHLSDVYLLGATLYHLVTLATPHTGKNINDILKKIRKGEWLCPLERNPGAQIPQELEHIITKSMALKKEDRYQTVEEMANAIDVFMAGHIVSTPLKFRAGQFIMHKGEIGTEGYVILRGNVKVFQSINGKDILIANLGPGDVVGEMAIISSQKRSANVMATEDTEVLIIDRKRLQEVLQRMPPWMGKILFALADRLLKANETVHPLKLEDPSFQILNQLALLCSMEVYRHEGKHKIEDLELDLQKVSRKISNLLYISEQKVQAILQRLIESEICEQVAESRFKIKDFHLYCQLLGFLHNLFGIDDSLAIPDLPDPSLQSQALISRVAEGLSNKVKEISRGGFVINRKEAFLEHAKPEVKTEEKWQEKEHKPFKRTSYVAEGNKELTHKIEKTVQGKLDEIQQLLEAHGLQEDIKVNYSVVAAGKQGENLSVKGELSKE